ncbi:MAG: glycosyltransferase family 39 protein [Saprospiraceae bacterium]|nr:glycosyltransferase family 39 protein [Saprospiraceae bacterium]MCC6412611.1 glycosyltransferase family 39 protein [Saprospiraceae bacterium]
MPRLNLFPYWIAAVVMLVYVAYRAWNLSFTHDEALSYTIVLGDTVRGASANHHYLNTWSMAFFHRFLGNSELSLRMGSVLAFVVYAWATVSLLGRSASGWVRLVGFALLMLNPFVLDFFSLARGYSFAMAGMMAALWSLVRAIEGRDFQSPLWLAAAVAFGALGVLGNLALLNFYLPLLAVVFFTGLMKYRNFSITTMLSGLVSLVWLPFFLKFILNESFRLKERGELYHGGNTGLFHDTVRSLAECSLYLESDGFSVETLAIAFCVLFVVVVVVAIWHTLEQQQWTALGAVGVVLGLTILSIAVQHVVLNTLLPTNRMVAYLLPLLGFGTVLWLDAWSRSTNLWTAPQIGPVVVSLLLTVLAATHFTQTANTTFCYMWHFDKNTKTFMDRLPAIRVEHLGGKNITLATHALFEPAANYYKDIRHYDWLETIPKDGVRDKIKDVYYTLEDDFPSIPGGDVRKVDRFDDTHSGVWVRWLK